MAFHQCRKRPADRAGEAGQQRDARDRLPGIFAVQVHQRCKRCVVQATTHGQAKQGPGRQHRHQPLRGCQRQQPGDEQRVGQQQHRAPALAVDPTADPGADGGAHQQRHRQRGVHGAGLHSQAARHRRRQHRRQVIRSRPDQGLRGAQRQHDVAGARQGEQTAAVQQVAASGRPLTAPCEANAGARPCHRPARELCKLGMVGVLIVAGPGGSSGAIP